jgi:hypothetical protein
MRGPTSFTFCNSFHEGEEVDESDFKALVRQAVALNSSGKSKPSKKAKS